MRVRLQRPAAGIAREGALFWIVRPQVGFGNITGLNTVLTGPEIQVLPGPADAPKRFEFVGLDSAPVGLETPGLKIVLRAERPRSIRQNTPVHYRGVEVGMVQNVDLGPNSISADVDVLIFERYAGLVRQGSVFWDTSGVNVRGGLLASRSTSNRCAPSLPAASSSPSEKSPRVKRARSSSSTTSRRKSGSPGCRASRSRRPRNRLRI